MFCQGRLTATWIQHRLIVHPSTSLTAVFLHNEYFLKTPFALVHSSLHSSAPQHVRSYDSVLSTASLSGPIRAKPHHITDKTLLSLVCSGDLTQSLTTIVSQACFQPPPLSLFLCLSTPVTNTASVSDVAQSNTCWFDYCCLYITQIKGYRPSRQAE